MQQIQAFKYELMPDGQQERQVVSLHTGKWFVSIQTECEVEKPIPQCEAIGIDLAIARFATRSDGTFYEPLNSLKRHEIALRKALQVLSRIVKFSHKGLKTKEMVGAVKSVAAEIYRNNSEAAPCHAVAP